MERTPLGSIEQIYKKTELKTLKMIFLDRDGVINKEGYIRNTSQIELLPTVTEGIRLLNKKGIICVVVTNQPAVAHKFITIKTLRKINDRLVEILAKNGAYINAVYSCPHHPDFMKCKCRKPEILMFKKALTKYNNPKILGIIGDQTRDVMAGKKLKIPTVIVKTGYGGRDGIYTASPDFICDDFLSAVKILIK